MRKQKLTLLSQKEGTFVKGFPVKKLYIATYLSCCLFGIMCTLGCFLFELFYEEILLYGLLISLLALFILCAVPAFLIIRFNTKIIKTIRFIKADNKAVLVKVVPYKAENTLSDGRTQCRLEVQFEYEGENVKLQSGGINKKFNAIQPNREITILYSNEYKDAIINLL